MWTLFPRYRTVRCPDGSKRYVYKNADDIFPIAKRDYNASLSSMIDPALAGGLDVSADLKQNIHNFLVTVDEDVKGLIISFRFAYAVYHSDPCNKSDYLQAKVDEITSKYYTFRSTIRLLELMIRFTIGADTQLPNQLRDQCNQLISVLFCTDESPVSTAFLSSQQAAEQLKEPPR